LSVLQLGCRLIWFKHRFCTSQVIDWKDRPGMIYSMSSGTSNHVLLAHHVEESSLH